MVDGPSIDWIMWSGTVGLESPVLPRIGPAAANGFKRLSVSPLDLARLAGAGTAPADVGRAIREAGLEVVLDPVMNWYPGGGPSRSRFASFSVEDSLRFCEQAGVVSMTAIATADGPSNVESLADPFGTLCDRCADLGIRVHLEFIPMTVVSDLVTAWSIVEQAGRDNGGILVDAWHFFRGSPDFDVLARIPGERIFGVQLDDASPAVQGSLWEDTQRRLLPGEGSFDLCRLVSALWEIGGLNWVGPEVIHPDLAAMPIEEAVWVATEATTRVVHSALSSGTGVPHVA